MGKWVSDRYWRWQIPGFLTLLTWDKNLAGFLSHQNCCSSDWLVQTSQMWSRPVLNMFSWKGWLIHSSFFVKVEQPWNREGDLLCTTINECFNEGRSSCVPVFLCLTWTTQNQEHGLYPRPPKTVKISDL